ncbi:MAG: histidine kinase [Chloroflexi bacterium]|nr:histidine kinase [Chloroflexota bacterium]
MSLTRRGDFQGCRRRYASALVSSTVTSLRLIAARPGSRSLVDVALAVAALAGTLSLLRHGGIGPLRPGSAELDALGVALVACSTLPLVAWRRSPLGVFTLTAAASVLLAGLGYGIDLLLGPTAALYLAAASRRRENPWTWRGTVVMVGLLLAYLGATAAAQGAFPGSELLHTGTAWSAAWFAGERTRLRREQMADLRARASRTERDAERERLLAAAEERARIARDLHDSAGHAINVIAVRAGAARLRHHQDPDRSLLALAEIEEVARQTAEEIDHIVGTIREGGSSNGIVEAPIGIASLDSLIARHREAGLQVTLNASGMSRRLGTAADQAAYRILQESLTNAARHGAGSVAIELTFGDEALEIGVTNPIAARRLPTSTGGHGLIGMRERATMLGGTLQAERADGSFRVRARIPYGGHAA